MPRTNDDDDAYQVGKSSAEDKRGNSLILLAARTPVSLLLYYGVEFVLLWVLSLTRRFPRNE